MEKFKKKKNIYIYIYIYILTFNTLIIKLFKALFNKFY